MDYRKLNDMIIKNQYLLPRANNMQEQLQKVIIFIQLDIRNIYYLIRIAKGKK
jgi:hypothetical protein